MGVLVINLPGFGIGGKEGVWLYLVLSLLGGCFNAVGYTQNNLNKL